MFKNTFSDVFLEYIVVEILSKARTNGLSFKFTNMFFVFLILRIIPFSSPRRNKNSSSKKQNVSPAKVLACQLAANFVRQTHQNRIFWMQAISTFDEFEVQSYGRLW